MEGSRGQSARYGEVNTEYERRFVEFRIEDDGAITGPIIVYGDEARFGDWRETFAPGSLRHSDVIVNIQHDRDRPIARTGAGLTLTDGPDAMRAHIVMPDTVYAREARELVQARLLRGFSIEFRAERDSWEGQKRTVHEAELRGLAIVDRPAYPDSVIAHRMAIAYGKLWPDPVRRYFF